LLLALVVPKSSRSTVHLPHPAVFGSHDVEALDGYISPVVDGSLDNLWSI
jgi:hypothetical protein